MELLLNIVMEQFLKMNEKFIDLLEQVNQEKNNTEVPHSIERAKSRNHFIAFGVVSTEGQLISGSKNVKVDKVDTGAYQIRLLNETIIPEPAFIVNAEGFEKSHATHFRNQDLSFTVTTWDIIGNPKDVSFSFISIGQLH
jgi:hypothetical protein